MLLPQILRGSDAESLKHSQFSDNDGWAFKPIRRPSFFKVGEQPTTDFSNPIDVLVANRLKEENITPNPRADQRVLLRRLYLVMTGLAPNAEEIEKFLNSNRPDQWEREVDRVLASPHYGERWGRHWLDLVRFAQSHGYERDGEKPNAWRFRDYVIHSLNKDKPYDQFIKEHLAGDEMATQLFSRQDSPENPEWKEALVGTAFTRLGVWDDEPDDKKMAVFDELDDMVSTTGSVMLGLTIGCARCHDHKTDPISQKDYYQLTSFFRGIQPYTNPAAGGEILKSSAQTPLASPTRLLQWSMEKDEKLGRIQKAIATATSEKEKHRLQQELSELQKLSPPFEFTLAAKESGNHPPSTHILKRGNAHQESDEVFPRLPQVFGGEAPEMSRLHESSGRRTALANWIASNKNPLTARVIVNRLWHYHFGRGIVTTTTDFGKTGSPPSHPELLDFLAHELIEGSWSLKRIHKMILMSETWRRSSSTANQQGDRIDPGNTLLWRQNMRRLEAEVIRDNVLAVSQDLNLEAGGRGFFPYLSGEVLEGASRPGTDWEVSTDAQQARRSVYAYVRRTSQVPFFEIFDYSNQFSPLGERPVTTVAPQALLLLNDHFMSERARSIAVRILNSQSNTSNLIHKAFVQILARPPKPSELQHITALLDSAEEDLLNHSTRVTFRTDTPATLNVSFFNQLLPTHFASASRKGWNSFRGSWPDAYEGNKIMDRQNGPFLLWDKPSSSFGHGKIEFRLTAHTALESASLLLQWSVQGEKHLGYEIKLVPRDQSLLVIRWDDKPSLLASSKLPLIQFNQAIPVRIQLNQGDFKIFWNDPTAPLLELKDSNPLKSKGSFGVRTWGAPLSLDQLSLTTGDLTFTTPSLTTNENLQKKLEMLCLALLNLNELVYLD